MTNVLILSRFGQKHLLNALNVNVNDPNVYFNHLSNEIDAKTYTLQLEAPEKQLRDI